MFDLRYHVASLAAVFLALIIGILVGAGLAARTDVEGSERRVLNERIAELDQRTKDLVAEAELMRRQQEAAEDYLELTYPVVMNGRLRAKRVAMLFVGPSDEGLLDAVEQTLSDASAPALVEMEALELPVDAEEIAGALGRRSPEPSLEEVGRRLGEELVEGGETPFWDALTPVLVQDHRGVSFVQADGVVVAVTGVVSDTATRRLVDGIYSGLVAAGVPVVGIERSDERPSRIGVYKANSLSSVDSVNLTVGRVALATLLAGGERGHYGLKRTAESGRLPPVEPLPLAPLPGG
ncbi:MAG TPA: copper transporter [Gaiellaceae bacterium]